MVQAGIQVSSWKPLHSSVGSVAFLGLNIAHEWHGKTDASLMVASVQAVQPCAVARQVKSQGNLGAVNLSALPIKAFKILIQCFLPFYSSSDLVKS